MYSETITKLINQFERLPGIGHKTAVRLAFYILEAPKSVAEEMSKVFLDAKKKLNFVHNVLILLSLILVKYVQVIKEMNQHYVL